jgi:hypothetical protein
VRRRRKFRKRISEDLKIIRCVFDLITKYPTYAIAAFVEIVQKIPSVCQGMSLLSLGDPRDRDPRDRPKG